MAASQPTNPKVTAREAHDMASNARREATHALASTERHAQLLQEMDQRYAQDATASNKKVIRMSRDIKLLGERLAQTHDYAVAELTPRVAKLEDLVGRNMGINLAAAIAGFTDDEIKQILAIQAEDQLTDSTVITGMVASIETLKTQMHVVTDITAETRGMVNRHEQEIAEIRQNTVDIDNSSVTVKKSQTFGTAALVAVVAFVVCLLAYSQFEFFPDGFEQHPGWSAFITALAVFCITFSFTERIDAELHLNRLPTPERKPEPEQAEQEPEPDATSVEHVVPGFDARQR